VHALAVVHQPDAGPGVFAAAAADAGWTLRLVDAPALPGELRGVDAVMTFGGSAHPDQDAAHAWMAGEVAWLAAVLRAEVPLLGVCLGAQLVARAAGGGARRAKRPEIGWHEVRIATAGREDPLLGPLAPSFEAFGWHSYECVLPPGAAALAASDICPQAFRAGERAWGIQFHAEVSAADALGWIDDYAADPDAVAAGVDPVALRTATEPRIDAWNELGRGLCRRFLAAAGG
jgi:GMP synthase-like glutamine amidotransferase